MVELKSIFAVDPGISTGVAWGTFNERAETASLALSEGIETGSLTLTGDEMSQAFALFVHWQRFKERAVLKQLMDPDDIELVIEDFILFPGAHAGGKDGIAPVRIGWAFEGYRQGRGDKYSKAKHVSPAIWQPSTVLRYEQSLKAAGHWVRGKQHERAAWCHVLARMKKLMR